ncbi:hypothetical protein SDC9_175893 [bioreactor metagenome]|uniref:Uncharacterized protein n=1 Tax=bioreactor metagenome TaxID=1076179 RepID=A0A645GNE2_9ZZZZ
MQQLDVGALDRLDQPGIVVTIMFRRLEQVARHDRRQRQRQHQRNGQRDGDGVGQRREHLAFHALQRHQRQENEDDDADAEDHRRRHLDDGAQDHPHLVLAGLPGTAELGEGVFDDDHRTVHHQADGDGQAAERHQVGRDAQLVHRKESEQGGQHQRGDDDQRRTHVAEEEEEHDNDQGDTFEQHLGHRP